MKYIATATASVQANVTLLDSAGNPIANQTVTITFTPSAGGTSSPLGTGTITTNASGQGTLTGSVPAPGTYNFAANFAGVSGQYNASSASQNNVAVATDTTLTLSIIVS